MACGDRGHYAHAGNMLTQCERFLLEREEAGAIIDDMEEQIGNSWYETTRRHGVSEEDCETISSAFLYPGFRLENVE